MLQFILLNALYVDDFRFTFILLRQLQHHLPLERVSYGQELTEAHQTNSLYDVNFEVKFLLQFRTLQLLRLCRLRITLCLKNMDVWYWFYFTCEKPFNDLKGYSTSTNSLRLVYSYFLRCWPFERQDSSSHQSTGCRYHASRDPNCSSRWTPISLPHRDPVCSCDLSWVYPAATWEHYCFTHLGAERVHGTNHSVAWFPPGMQN